MPFAQYEIRLCDSCGLRYPLPEGHPFGTRCPACMGDTRLLLSRKLILETEQPRPGSEPLLPKSDDFGEGAHKQGVVAVLLDNIRSAWNTGSILRSADGFGFAHAYLCGITPTPENEAVTKTSLGAEDSVPWSYHKDAVKLVKSLKKTGWHIVALEEHPQAIPLHALKPPPPEYRPNTLLIVGSEVTGVDPGLLNLCDQIAHIPMRGGKKSFNVAIAFGIAAFQLNQ